MPKEKETLEVFRIFIASPGDVGKERRIFRTVIEELNDIKAAGAGKRLVPVGWEDTLPGRGRPQALINEDLVSCDLIVGLLWRRWGSTRCAVIWTRPRRCIKNPSRCSKNWEVNPGSNW